ncbi:MAG: ABC transporter permease [Acidobacteriota bacterium]
MRAQFKHFFLKPHLWLIRFVGLIVPRRLRPDWRQEWEAELRHRETMLAEWDKLNWQTKLDLFWRSTSAFWDALWLQPKRMEDEMIQDLRFGIRMLLKHKGFTAVAVMSLALGIGANMAIFQLLDAVRLRLLPVNAPRELVEVRPNELSTSNRRGSKSTRYPAITNPLWEQLRERQQSFSSLSAWSTGNFNLAQGGEVRNARMLWVSGEFFPTLGVQASLGRVFTAADDQRGSGARNAVISHSFWQREYGGEPNIIGRKIMLAEQPFDIIGVTPASFFGLEVGQNFDVALPICAEAITAGKNNRLDSGTHWWLMVTGRLKPGRTLAQASAEMQTMSSSLFEKTLPTNYPPVSRQNYLNSKLEAAAAGAGYSVLRANYEDSLWLLLAIAGLVLLIACANLANLLLARASARAREMAVRQALGASRARLVRQLLAESLLLAFIGAALGAALAQGLSRFMIAYLNTGGDTVFLNLGVDWRVLGFATGLALLTCLLFGLMPAIRAARIEPGAVMKAAGRGLTAGRERFSLRRALVVAQVALSLVLVAGALLFTRSLNKLLTVDTGFQSEGILITRLRFGPLNLPPERSLPFKQEIIARLQTIPGVQSVTETNVVPLSGNAGGNQVWQDGTNGQQKVGANVSMIGPDYFRTLTTPLLAGREFKESDNATAPKVAIVNESFARQVVNSANPIGQRFRVEATPTDPESVYEIVGLVKDTKYLQLSEEVGATMFYPIAQVNPSPTGAQLLIKSSLPQAEITAAVKRTLHDINPSLLVIFQGFKTMIENSLLRERLLATLSGFFGVLALVLASIGLYGILSYGVASRTNEIGIRMALGARQRDVLWLVLREALLLVLAGLAVGLPVIFLTTRFVATLLYGLPPTDVVSLSFATLLLVAVAFIAGYLPARRATRIDPMVALRCD